MSEAPAAAKEKAKAIRIRAACRHCGKVNVKNSRKGFTWKCSSCGTVNPGPGLEAEMAKPPAPEKRRIETRRAAAAEKRAPAPAKPAGAPVRRKARTPAPTEPSGTAAVGATKTAGAASPPAPAPAPAPVKRGFFDRVMYGSD